VLSHNEVPLGILVHLKQSNDIWVILHSSLYLTVMVALTIVFKISISERKRYSSLPLKKLFFMILTALLTLVFL
jgi:hypothetical protein